MKSKNIRFLQMYSWNSRWTHVLVSEGIWRKLDSVDLGDPRGGRRWGSYLWTEAFGGKSKLPANHEELRVTVLERDGMTAEFILKPIGPKLQRGRSGMKHRVFVKCNLCGKEVPAGRIHQHTC